MLLKQTKDDFRFIFNLMVKEMLFGTGCLMLCFILIGCTKSMYLDAGIIMRDNRKSTYFKKHYEPIDSISISSIRICKSEIGAYRLRTDKLYTDGKISFKKDSLLNYLNTALKNHFEYVEPLTNHSRKWERDCQRLNLSSFQNINPKDKVGYSAHLVFDIKYGTTKNFDVDVSFGPSVYVEDNDKHNIEYILTIAIFKNGQLEYLDNRTYWDDVYSARGEHLNFLVRKNSIDSLMNLSLKKYRKRISN